MGIAYGWNGNGGAGSLTGQVITALQFVSTQASGSDAFKVTTNGARWHFGAGASDYASSDGTTVTFAGPLASASSIQGSSLIATGASGVSTLAIIAPSGNPGRISGQVANGATAIGVKLSPFSAYTTAGARIAVFYSDNITTEAAAIDKDGAIRLNIPGGASQPAAAAALRGTIWYTAGGAGVADKIEICAKDSLDAYAWIPLATPIT